MGRYDEVFRRSLQEPETFWAEAAHALRWRKPWNRVLDRDDPRRPRWFEGGELNSCENALDVHVESGRGDQVALIWDSAVANQTMKYTYRELLQETARFAGALRRLGAGKGDRVVIYMPMVPQALIAMLACARIGAVHSVVFGGFAAHELAARIEHARPKLIVCGSCGLEPGRTVPYKPMVDKAISISRHKPDNVILLQRPQLAGEPVGTPDAGAFWRVVSQHGVQTLFTAPTAFRAIRREDPEGKFIQKYQPAKSLRALFLAGERCDPETLQWAQQKLRIPVVDHWWQTETGWPIVGNPLGIEEFPVKPGSATKPVPGYDVRVLDETGADVPRGQSGAIAIKLPLPPGCLPTLYEDDANFVQAYLSRYPGFYLTGDGGFFDQDGYLSIMGRINAVINVAGHRLSTGAMEEILASHKDVAECAVVGVNDQLKGEVPVGFVVLKSGVRRDEKELVKELVDLVRERIGPVAFFKQAAIVAKLPKTRSGKILRGTIRKIADGIEYTTPPTIEDPVTLQDMGRVLSKLGYPRKV